jgi:solute carrier family 30 (zinc transporter), member 9
MLVRRFRLNHRPTTTGIRKLLMARPGIDNVQSVQSQWIGPYTFAYKAEVDFDGTYLAAKLMARYEDEFLGSPQLKEDLPVLLAFYAEDVVRTLEREVREVEREIRWV